MPVRKRQRRDVVVVTDTEAIDGVETKNEMVMVRLVDENGDLAGTQILLPVSATPKQLDELLCSMLGEDARTTPYAFFIEGEQVNASVQETLFKKQQESFIDKMLKEGRRVRPQDVEKLLFELPEETIIDIQYKPQAKFRVRPVTRCAGTLDGHSEAVLIVSFSPDSEVLASGGGDKEIRLWDVHTLTPTEELTAHKSWVQVLSWAPDGKHLVSGSKDGVLIVWSHDGAYGSFKGKQHKAHSSYLSHVSWEPLHKNTACDRFVSASKDASLKVWHTINGFQYSLSGHQACVTCVKWGGENLIYSSSQDRSIIVWDASNGSPRSILRGHAHWVNFVALSTDLVIRTGPFDHEGNKFDSRVEMQRHAEARYKEVLSRIGGYECLVSCSDDNTMFLWSPQQQVTPLGRMTGHQGAIFHIQFSPDGTMIASCSADKSVKLWNASDGKFITTFRGHVAPVYHVSWSLDSRLLVSGSRDSTLKLWSVSSRELVEDLSGHSDEIFSTDWSPDGQRVATGSKDKKVLIWVH
ncbi:notchless [Trypanosoma grayi]|uniref:notchless n=1 Tax=Trypanosoma grayi TaxID=71804 RepID=UPI0004F4B603|nr:notchless [Trypanosoma grayi]KEG11321.1 notchless [Trypanosoma grayi]